MQGGAGGDGFIAGDMGGAAVLFKNDMAFLCYQDTATEALGFKYRIVPELAGIVDTAAIRCREGRSRGEMIYRDRIGRVFRCRR